MGVKKFLSDTGLCKDLKVGIRRCEEQVPHSKETVFEENTIIDII